MQKGVVVLHTFWHRYTTVILRHSFWNKEHLINKIFIETLILEQGTLNE